MLHDNLDRIARVFSWVIDAKSPWTLLHSENVARISRDIAVRLGLSEIECRDIYRAGLLHDIGKLAVSNLILDKPGPLDEAEWAVLRSHPRHSREILGRVPALSHLAPAAGAHHERLDGAGYDRGLRGAELDTASRILGIADRFEAMTAYRPYRDETPTCEVLDVLGSDVGEGVCADAFDALRAVTAAGPSLAAQSLASARVSGAVSRMEWLESVRTARPALSPA